MFKRGGRDFMKRIIGYILYQLIGKHLPSSYARCSLGSIHFRRLCGKLMLAKCGKNVNIERNASFSTRTQLGDYSGIGLRAKLYGPVIIGNHVMMGPDCILYTQNHNFSNISIPMDQQGFQEEKEVIIEDDVWIGGRVIILPGVKIGKGSIIGAGAVVSKNVDPYSIVVGNPARR